MKKGFTLTEVLITVIISGILFLTIGIMFYNTIGFQKKGETKIDLQGKIRYAEFHIKTELRKATSFYIENPTTLRFCVPENSIRRTLTLTGDQLVLQISNTDNVVLLEAINNFRVQQVGISSDTLKFEISVSSRGFNNEIFNSSTTFFVKIRNKFVPPW